MKKAGLKAQLEAFKLAIADALDALAEDDPDLAFQILSEVAPEENDGPDEGSMMTARHRRRAQARGCSA